MTSPGFREICNARCGCTVPLDTVKAARKTQRDKNGIVQADAIALCGGISEAHSNCLAWEPIAAEVSRMGAPAKRRSVHARAEKLGLRTIIVALHSPPLYPTYPSTYCLPVYIFSSINMLGLRNIARAAPRSAARLSARAIRPQSSLVRPAAVLPAWTQSVPRLTASFHLSAIRRQDSDGTQRDWNHKEPS